MESLLKSKYLSLGFLFIVGAYAAGVLLAKPLGGIAAATLALFAAVILMSGFPSTIPPEPIAEAIHDVLRGLGVTRPAKLTPAAALLFLRLEKLAKKLEGLKSTLRDSEEAVEQRRSEADSASRAAEAGKRAADTARREADELKRELETAHRRVYQDASRITMLTAALDETAENIANLASIMPPVVDSIDWMVFSINEVARHAAELQSTAEWISASMKSFHVSIAQVDSNAEETARLSEEVADAERSAESLLRNLSELNRIRIISPDTVNIEGSNNSVARGLTLSAEVERDLKKILDFAQRSAAMLRVSARVLVAEVHASNQLRDPIDQFAGMAHPIAFATNEQVRGSALLTKSMQRMQNIVQHLAKQGADWTVQKDQEK